jgi:transposase
MTDLFLLSEAQMRRIERYFPLSHGIARVDDRRVVSAIVFVIKNGLRWRDAPREYGPHKTIYNRFVRWSRLGVFNKIFAALARKGGKPERIMIDATHLKAHRTAASLLKKGLFPDVSGAPGLNSKLHAVCDGHGRPLVMLLSEGQMSDYKGAALMLPAMPKGKRLLADKGYDADWFRAALAKRPIAACIPSKSNRKTAIPYDAVLTNSATRSKTFSGASKTGGASIPDTTAALTPTSRQSASPQPSLFGSDQ